jgi:hypothetical protein
VADLEGLVEGARAFLARFDPDRHPPADVRRAVGLFSTLANLATAGLVLGAPRLAGSAPEATGRRSAAEDLASITGSSLSEAHRLLTVGETSRSSSGMAGALRNGSLSRERAALVSDGIAAAPGAEDELLRAATAEPFGRLRDRQRHAKARGRRAEDDRARAARLLAGRRLRTFLDDDGYFRLEAYLTPDAGARLSDHLEATTDRILTEGRRTGVSEGPDAARADALCALCDRGGAAGPASCGEPESASGSGSGRQLPGPRAAVTLRVDLAALRRGELGDGEVCEIPGVGAVPLAVARSLLGDAVVDLVIANGVDVTTTAHLGRTVPAALRRALAERDEGCVIPGCGAQWTLEVDHWRLPFAEGGAASLDNLVTLCRFHHHLRHYRGYVLSGGPGRWRFRPPRSGPPTEPEPPPGRHPA